MAEQQKALKRAGLVAMNVLMFSLAALVAAFVVHLVKTQVIPKYFPAVAAQTEAKP